MMRSVVALLGLLPLVVSCSSEDSAESSTDPGKSTGVTIIDGGTHDGYCSPAAKEIVEDLAKQHADAGDGTILMILDAGETLVLSIPIEEERNNLVATFLVGKEVSWHKAVQGMYDSCTRRVYIYNPEDSDDTVGFELDQLTYVTK